MSTVPPFLPLNLHSTLSFPIIAHYWGPDLCMASCLHIYLPHVLYMYTLQSLYTLAEWAVLALSVREIEKPWLWDYTVRLEPQVQLKSSSAQLYHLPAGLLCFFYLSTAKLCWHQCHWREKAMTGWVVLWLHHLTPKLFLIFHFISAALALAALRCITKIIIFNTPSVHICYNCYCVKVFPSWVC